MSDDVERSRTSRAWIIALIAVGILLAVVAVLIATGVLPIGPQQSASAPSPSASETSEPSPTATEAPTPTPTPTPAADLAAIAAVLDGGDASAFGAHLADQVTLAVAASEGGVVTREQAVEAISTYGSQGAPWQFPLDEATVQQFRSGDYATYFPEGVAVGRASDGAIVAFQFTDGLISSVLYSVSEDLLL